MKHLKQIALKELTAFFSSLAAFIFFGSFLAVTLFIFFWAEPFFARNTADVRPLFEWMPTLMVFLVSALTMRMWSEEKRSGTIEFLLTSPITNLELVLGKFLACIALVLIALALTLPLPITVSLIGPLDWGPVIGGYIASIFLAASYIAIGLFISARTENQIVSLILSVLVCSSLVVLGSDALTNLFVTQVADVMKLLGSSSRFQSITRGVIDFRDLYYYLSLTGVFLALNVLGLEKMRWAGNKTNQRHRAWLVLTSLCVANLLAGNFWLQQISSARIDLTDGQIYSISSVTRNYLANLKEPLLIRAYFSQRTHPFLQPLKPRMRDLLKEYAMAGKGKVVLEFVDPLENPNLEKEAIEKYNIHPVTFQTQSRSQAALTSSYFDILIKYGDQFETLSFKNLVAVKTTGDNQKSVDLKNPEYEITRSIKRVMASYQSEGNPFLGINHTVKFIGYASPDDKLPEYLRKSKEYYEKMLSDLKAKSDGKFTYEFVDPDANGGAKAQELTKRFGFRALASDAGNKPFWFNMTLRDDERLLALTIPTEARKDMLERDLKSALRRFSRAFIKTVGIYAAPNESLFDPNDDYRKFYNGLEKKLTDSHVILPVKLVEGAVPPQVDILLVLAPYKLNSRELFAIDQFLMKGGTVLFTTAPYDANIVKPPLSCRKNESGLEKWFQEKGIEFENSLLLDPQDFPFPMPMSRMIEGTQVTGVQMVPYPFFVDVRKDGMNADGAITGGVNQVTLAWTSPIKVDAEKNKQRHVIKLLESSAQSWTTNDTRIIPLFSDQTKLGFPEGKDKGRKLIAVAVEGSFDSYYKGAKSPIAVDFELGKDSLDKKDSDKTAGQEAVFNNVIEKSPESARIILIASNDFVNDRLLYFISNGLGTQYDAPVDLVDNAVDWSLEDRQILSIRSRGAFARTLLNLNQTGTMIFEYSNYFLAIMGLCFVWLLRRQFLRAAQKRYQRLLEAAAGSSPANSTEGVRK